MSGIVKQQIICNNYLETTIIYNEEQERNTKHTENEETITCAHFTIIAHKLNCTYNFA